MTGLLKIAGIRLEVDRTTDNTERQSYAQEKCREAQEAQRCLNAECKPRGGSLQKRGDSEADGRLEVKQNQKLARYQSREPRAREPNNQG